MSRQCSNCEVPGLYLAVGGETLMHALLALEQYNIAKSIMVISSYGARIHRPPNWSTLNYWLAGAAIASFFYLPLAHVISFWCNLCKLAHTKNPDYQYGAPLATLDLLLTHASQYYWLGQFGVWGDKLLGQFCFIKAFH